MKTIYTGARCGCKRGQQRDNCPACEGTGRQIDFAAMRARKAPATRAQATPGPYQVAEVFNAGPECLQEDCRAEAAANARLIAAAPVLRDALRDLQASVQKWAPQIDQSRARAALKAAE